jgi:NADH-quinone oxidoreductase subunit H
MITVSVLAALLFLAGWEGPLLPPIFWFVVKVVFFIFVFIWLRTTMPRLRYDMLMRLGWKVLLPLAILNVMVTAIVLVAVQ